MQLCGCLPVGHRARSNDNKQSDTKQSTKKYSLKRSMFKKKVKFIILLFVFLWADASTNENYSSNEME